MEPTSAPIKSAVAIRGDVEVTDATPAVAIRAAAMATAAATHVTAASAAVAVVPVAAT